MNELKVKKTREEMDIILDHLSLAGKIHVQGGKIYV